MPEKMETQESLKIEKRKFPINRNGSKLQKKTNMDDKQKYDE